MDRLRKVDPTAPVSRGDFTLNGEVVLATPDSVVLSASDVVFDAGYRGTDVTRQVVLLRGEIESAEGRTLDRKKTTVAIVGGSAAIIVAIVKWRNGGYALGGGRSGGGPAEVRRP